MTNLGSYQTMTTMAKECGGPTMFALMLIFGGCMIGYAFKAIVDDVRNDRKVIVINNKEQSA